MTKENSFDVNIFTDTTKNICSCTLISIVLIIFFIISPLSNFFKTSFFFKIIILFILFYIIYLNNHQTNILRNVINKTNFSSEIYSYLNTNIYCSYIFTIFIGLLIIFVIKTFL